MAENIRKLIIENRKVLSPHDYKEWLGKKLDQYGIDHQRLTAVVIVVERALSSEMQRSGSNRARPYYKLYNDDGSQTRAWIYAAELALWLKYNSFKANPYVHSIVEHPFVRRQVMRQSKKQVPLNVLFPTTRRNSDRFREYSRHFRSWLDKH